MNSMSVIKNGNVLTPITKTFGNFYVKLIVQSVHNKTEITQIHDNWENLRKLHSGTQL